MVKDFIVFINKRVQYVKHFLCRVYPSLYYTVKYELSDGTDIDIIMIDTITLCGKAKDLKNAGIVEEFFTPEHELRGPLNVQLANAQWIWLEEQLKASR